VPHDPALRIFDADDLPAALGRVLPALTGARGRCRAVYAEYDGVRRLLTRSWTIGPDGSLSERALELDPSRLHPLLRDDVSGHRPLRPIEAAPAWVLKDVFREHELARRSLRVRVIADGGRWLGVLALACVTQLFRRGDDPGLQTLGDALELALGRIAARERLTELEQRHRRAFEHAALQSSERLQRTERELAEMRAARAGGEPRLRAMEDAAGRATELLMDAHVELAGRTERLRRQTRVLYLLRKLLDDYSDGIAADALAGEVVRVVSEAFGGERCSLLLADPGDAGRGLRLAAAQGLPPEVDLAAVAVEIGRGVSGWVAHHRTPLVVREGGEVDAADLVQDEAYTGPAFASMPLTCNGRLLGVLNLTNFRDGTFSDAEVEMLRLVVRSLALVVDHARLREQLFDPPPSAPQRIP
jgi:hypothetical protein